MQSKISPRALRSCWSYRSLPLGSSSLGACSVLYTHPFLSISHKGFAACQYHQIIPYTM